LPWADLRIEGAKAEVAIGLERAHAEFLSQGESLLVIGFSLLSIRGVGVGLNDAKLAERERLEPALAVPLGQVERLACVLPSLLIVPLEETDRAEPCEIEGLRVQSAHAATFPERLLQERAPLGEVARKRQRIAEGSRGRSSDVPVVGGAAEGQALV